MNNFASTSKAIAVVCEDNEIFEDSSILANFNNSSFKETRFSANNLDESLNKSELNVSALCCDEEISGYDKLTGRTWIYPTNYPVRDYQFNIIKAAILKNTLVSLPTGLGKTFIAAVIMYNFYRWYPLGKIVFTAPTRPLVAQQIEACYNIIAIPPNDSVEMTGHMQVNTRKAHWQTKRVFFATPQVIYNDIKSGICPGDKIRCLVFDEAHRARGNYAYCQIMSTLTDMGHKTFRILALSATPGSKVEDVVNVVKNLHIACLELRTENCIDVAPYSHARDINTVIVQLGPELTQLRQQYVEILDGYARRLKQLNILPQNLGNLSKGRIVMLYKEFQGKDRGARHPQHNYIMKDFTLLIALYHGLELLVKHGSRVFLNFFDEHPEKSWIQSDDKLTALLERLRDDLGINPLSLDRSILPDGTIPDIPKNLCFGHPKFYRLKEIMMEHFHRAKEKAQDTRAIVFCEYRESVNLVHCLLLQCRPLITPQMFVGQGASGKDGKTVVSQKQQLRVMRSFREGACNTLVATCVAEEGLDVGSVDLILCFDISTRSPIRLVQRCGRTGRERGGKVHILVTEGREHQTLLDCMRQRDGLNRKVLHSKEVQNSLYALNPRMMPRDHAPVCQKMYITVAKKDVREDDKSKKGQKDLRTMLLGRASSSSSSSSKELEGANLITAEEFNEVFPEGYGNTTHLEEPQELWAKSKETIKALSKADETGRIKLSTWLEWQRTLQKTVNIGHSGDTQILAALLQYSDAKRFDMPTSTQNPSFNTQDFATQNVVSPVKVPSPMKLKQPKKKPKIPLIKSPCKKDGDIRALFSTATKSTKNYTKLINNLGVQDNGTIPTRLLNLLVDLSLENTNSTRKCYICQNVCDCTIFKNMKINQKSKVLLTFIKEPKLPELDLIDDIDAELILRCANNDTIHFETDVVNDNVTYLGADNIHNCSNNFDLKFDFDSPIDLTSPGEIVEAKQLNENSEKNFDIGDIEDIFADSSPEEAVKNNVNDDKENNSADHKEALGFFGLDSIDDIFADSDDSNGDNASKTSSNLVNNENKDEKIINTQLKTSPSLLSGKQKIDIPTSPILCSQIRKFKLSTKKKPLSSSTPVSNVRRQLIPGPEYNNIDMMPEHKILNANSNIQSSVADATNKSMFTITQLVEMINKTDVDKTALTKSINSHEVEKDISANEDNRSPSPIILTQADRKKSLNNVNDTVLNKLFSTSPKKIESLIILESDSDSENDNTQLYEMEDKNSFHEPKDADLSMTPKKSKTNSDMEGNANELKSTDLNSPINNKRKLEFDADDNASPYFNKKPRLDNVTGKKLSLQEKILAALTSNKMDTQTFNNNSNVNFVFSPRSGTSSQKENKNPQFLENGRHCNDSDDEKEYIRKNNLEMLQMFRRDYKTCSTKTELKSVVKSPNNEISQKRKINFYDSDDDFINDNKSQRNQRPGNRVHENKATTNHKVRKKKKKGNEFLDLEAELSDDNDHSGDELSDDSIGSIVDFICDENITHHEDMQAHYMRSVKSPVRGVFKIPQLPKNKSEIFSQFVEEDNYEMDSFCVDSHIGLTQVNDVSELEVAEMVLEQRKAKKKTKHRPESMKQNDDSPIVRRKNRNVKRLIDSDSDSS